jgi:hypothetical protein
MTNQQYQKCIDACIECASICNQCAVSCLEEKDVQHLTKCIRLNLECAVICRASAEIMSIGSMFSKQICKICAAVCIACADECEKHAAMGMEHCKECAEACRACAKETMEVYQSLEKQNDETKTTIVHQHESSILSRASAELMSLGSLYCQQICELTALACNASSAAIENHLNVEMKHSKECALISNEASQHLENQDQAIKEAYLDVSGKNNEQPEHEKEVVKKKKKHSSALLAASMWRSPVGHSLLHVSHDVGGYSKLPNTGPFIKYDE